MPDTDWDITEGLDPEGPSGDDLDRFGDELVPCASCGRRVYDQAEVCPICGGFVHKTLSKTPKWAFLVALVLIAVMVLFWVL